MDDYDDMKAVCSDVAKKLFDYNQSHDGCGPLHLGWLMDEYWGMVTENVLLPNSIKIYDALVAKNITEENQTDFNDGDDRVFFIPAHNGIKAWVHTTQNRDYVFIHDGDKFHVRRIYRVWGKRNAYQTVKDIIGSLKKALANVETLSEYNDDHYEFSHRPSLEAYRKKNFNVKYGDFRDPGYVLSYNGFYSKVKAPGAPKVEGSKYSFGELEVVTLYQCSIILALEENE